jgi:hypothetical protein
MSRFYFCTQEGGRLAVDDEGTELPRLDVARQEAVKAAREIVAECVRTGRELDVEALIVTDARGYPVIVLPLEEVLPQRLRRR